MISRFGLPPRANPDPTSDAIQRTLAPRYGRSKERGLRDTKVPGNRSQKRASAPCEHPTFADRARQIRVAFVCLGEKPGTACSCSCSRFTPIFGLVLEMGAVFRFAEHYVEVVRMGKKKIHSGRALPKAVSWLWTLRKLTAFDKLLARWVLRLGITSRCLQQGELSEDIALLKSPLIRSHSSREVFLIFHILGKFSMPQLEPVSNRHYAAALATRLPYIQVP